MDQQKSKTSQLVTSAVMIGLAIILSMVKVINMPWGGSVTLLSMLPIVIVSIRYGIKWGFVTSFLYAVAQIFVDMGSLMSFGMTPIIWVGCLVFDYLVAYGCLGIAGLFRQHGTKGICAGITLALTIRFLSHVISGVVFFQQFCWEGWNLLLYSVCYNGAYMLPELVFTLLATILLLRTTVFQNLIKNQ